MSISCGPEEKQGENKSRIKEISVDQTVFLLVGMVMFFNTANLASNSNVGVRHAHFDSWPPKQESEALEKLNGIELILGMLQVDFL